MLDLNLIRQQKDVVKKSLLKRMAETDLNLDEILKIDEQRRELIIKTEELKAERNNFSKIKPNNLQQKMKYR